MTDEQFNTGTRSQPLGDPKAGVCAELDALAAYAASLTSFAPSPLRNPDGTLTAAAIAGRQLFQAKRLRELPRRQRIHEERRATTRRTSARSTPTAEIASAGR